MVPTLEHLSEQLHRALGNTWAGATVAVAWSGGLDSTVLADLARRLGERDELEVCAIHVQHDVREGAADDVAFCRRQATDWGMPLVVEDLVPREETPSLEAQLRRQRYAALGEAAERLEADILLTAHQADDAIETALLRFVRGSGSAGLSSLAPRHALLPADAAGPIASWPPIPLGRPLLEFGRDDLREYAEAHSLDWREDPSNLSTAHTRNRLRQEILPTLEREAGSLQPILRTLDNLADDAAAIDERVDRLFDQARRPAPSFGSVACSTGDLAEAPRAETVALLRRAGGQLPSPPRWTRERLEAAVTAIETVAAGDETYRRLTLGGAIVVVEPERLVLAQSRERGGREFADRRALPRQISLSSNHSVTWFDHRLTFELLEPETPTDFPRDPRTAWFDADPLPDSLELRGPLRGERLAALGASGRTPLADILRDGGIPRSIRWRWPCLALPAAPAEQNERANRGECLWVCGLRQSRATAVTDATDTVLAVEISASKPIDP